MKRLRWPLVEVEVRIGLKESRLVQAQSLQDRLVTYGGGRSRRKLLGKRMLDRLLPPSDVEIGRVGGRKK